MGTTAIQDQLISGIQASLYPEVKSAVADLAKVAPDLAKAELAAILRTEYRRAIVPLIPKGATIDQLVDAQHANTQAEADDLVVSEAEKKNAAQAAAARDRAVKFVQAGVVAVLGAAVVAGEKSISTALKV
jgi:hypothetical protein